MDVMGAGLFSFAGHIERHRLRCYIAITSAGRFIFRIHRLRSFLWECICW